MELPEAWPQGSSHEIYPVVDSEDASTWPTTEVLLEGWGDIDIQKYPDLARATANQRDCLREKIEWLVDTPKDRKIEHNFTQILRFSGNITEEDEAQVKAELFDKLCSAANMIVRYGHRACDDKYPYIRTMCGGYLELLGREIRDDDVLALRPLKSRSPFWRRTIYPGGSVIGEWITEFSLEVIPGAN